MPCRFLASVSALVTVACLSFAPCCSAVAATGMELVPAPMALPGSEGVLRLLLLLTFFIHLLLISVVLGSVLLAVLSPLARPRFADGPDHDLAFLPKVLALGVNLGVAPVLFVQVLYSQFFYPGALLMAVWWLSIVAFVMIAYYGLYVMTEKTKHVFSGRQLVLVLVALLLLCVAFLFTNLSTLMIRPDQWLRWREYSYGVLLNWGDPTLVPRYAHMVCSALAVGGLTMACRALWSRHRGHMPMEEAGRRVRHGLAWFRYATLIQVPLGLIFLFTLPARVRALFLGGDMTATLALILALAGLVLMQLTARRGSVKGSVLVLLAMVFLMVNIRDMVRTAMFFPYLDQPMDPLPIMGGQDSLFAVFMGCVLLSLVALAWMGLVLYRACVRPADSGCEEV